MRRALLVLGVVCLLTATVAPAGAIHKTGEQLVVSLETDGDATVTKVTRYDLSNESQRRTFEELETNETARRQRAAEYRAYLERGARLGEERTHRSMSVSEVAVNVTRQNGTGVVRLRAQWTNLAAVNRDQDSVVVTEPFASGFPVNRTLVVEGPPGFTRSLTHPAPGRALKNSAYWGAETDLSGFIAGFTGDLPSPTPTTTPTAAPVTVEGLSALANAAGLALLPAALLVVAFRRAGR